MRRLGDWTMMNLGQPTSSTALCANFTRGAITSSSQVEVRTASGLYSRVGASTSAASQRELSYLTGSATSTPTYGLQTPIANRVSKHLRTTVSSPMYPPLKGGHFYVKYLGYPVKPVSDERAGVGHFS